MCSGRAGTATLCSNRWAISVRPWASTVTRYYPRAGNMEAEPLIYLHGSVPRVAGR